MDEKTAREDGQSFYELLYQLDRPGQSIVTDRESDNIYLMKKCWIYNIDVFRFLHDNPNPHIPRIRAFWENKEKTELTVVEDMVSGVRLDALLEENRISFEESLLIKSQGVN